MPPWITSLLREDTPLPMPLGRLGDDHLMAVERRRARDREPDHAGADDKHLHQARARCLMVPPAAAFAEACARVRHAQRADLTMKPVHLHEMHHAMPRYDEPRNQSTARRIVDCMVDVGVQNDDPVRRWIAQRALSPFR